MECEICSLSGKMIANEIPLWKKIPPWNLEVEHDFGNISKINNLLRGNG